MTEETANIYYVSQFIPIVLEVLQEFEEEQKEMDEIGKIGVKNATLTQQKVVDEYNSKLISDRKWIDDARFGMMVLLNRLAQKDKLDTGRKDKMITGTTEILKRTNASYNKMRDCLSQVYKMLDDPGLNIELSREALKQLVHDNLYK